jgi:hypothetical protein
MLAILLFIPHFTSFLFDVSIAVIFKMCQEYDNNINEV